MPPSDAPFLRALHRLRAAFWRRRVAYWVIRTVWVALLVPSVFMAGYLWLGWQVRWQVWFYPMLALSLLSIFWAMRPISLKRVVHRLDRRLGLRTQLITAFEVSQADPFADNLVVQRLLQSAVGQVVDLRRRVRLFNRSLWLEVQALIGVSTLLGAMLLLDALNPSAPNATPVSLPTPLTEPSADQVIPPDPRLFPPPFSPEMQVQQSAGGVQAALEALADALRDQAITRAAAEAIDQGDLPAAAEALRRLADQLGDVSAGARQQLGESLAEAGAATGPDVPGLTGPLAAGSRALAQEDVPAAQEALEALAEALEALAQQPQAAAQAPEEAQEPAAEPQPASPEDGQAQAGAGAGEGQGENGSQPGEAERLAVEGEPLELESDPSLEDRVLQPAELGAEAGDRTTQDSPFARGSANAAGELGPDPLTYPWDKREMIKRYFTP
jgi:hypothetical protein